MDTVLSDNGRHFLSALFDKIAPMEMLILIIVVGLLLVGGVWLTATRGTAIGKNKLLTKTNEMLIEELRRREASDEVRGGLEKDIEDLLPGDSTPIIGGVPEPDSNGEDTPSRGT